MNIDFCFGIASGANADAPEAVKQYEKIEQLAETLTPNGLNHEVYFQFGSAVERTGDTQDPGGRANDHRASDSAMVMVPNPLASKSV